jgi:predicted NBD/HSP70 family sugar kinase
MSILPYLAIDLGGSNTRLGLFPSLEVADFLPLASFPTQQRYKDQLTSIRATLQERGIAELAGAGVSIAARVAKDGRSLIFGPNLPDYLHRPFAADLEACLGCAVRLGHDTVCGLLGEWRFGALRTIERSAYLTVSTGTGAAIQLCKGGTRLTSSIEIGHQILDGNERLCLCGQVGCLETFTGGRQLELRYGCPLAELADPAFWQLFSEKLAIGLLNLAQLTRIDAVAIGGAIALQKPLLRERLQLSINERLKEAELTLLPAVLGEHAPLTGAAALWAVAEDTILH